MVFSVLAFALIEFVGSSSLIPSWPPAVLRTKCTSGLEFAETLSLLGLCVAVGRGLPVDLQLT